MPGEESSLLDRNVSIVQVNGDDGALFIDSYDRDARGDLIVNKPKPLCRLRDKNGLCSVHDVKPLPCFLYPLGIEMVDGTPYWALFLYCNHVRMLCQQPDGLELLKARAMQVVGAIHPELAREIHDQYLKVQDISYDPPSEERAWTPLRSLVAD